MTDVWLGIDGGGSGTRAAAMDSQGAVLSVGEGPSSNRNHHTPEEVGAALREAVAACLRPLALPRLRGVAIGVCGVSTEADRFDFAELARRSLELPANLPMHVANDAEVALDGGLELGPGLVLIAGTGSACFGRNAAGEAHWCGGWGALADDAGSGYWIAVEAIRAAVRMEDGRTPETGLKRLVFDWLGLSFSRELIDQLHNPGLPREDLARLAPRVLEAASSDPAARQIVESAASELAALASVCLDRLFPGQDPVAALPVGGLLGPGSAVRARVGELARRIRFVDGARSPAENAAWLARRLFGEVSP